MIIAHARLAMAALSFAALVACTSPTASKPPSDLVDAWLKVTPESARTRASGAPVKFIAQAGGITPSSISWTLNGPGSLGANTGANTIYTPPPDGTSQVTVTVTARAGEICASAIVDVDPLVGETVSGRVLDGPAGQGVAGVTVMIIGNTPTTTDSQGRFVVPGVKTPYDVAFGNAVPGKVSFVQINGVTSLNPVLVPMPIVELIYGSPLREHRVGIHGRITGGVASPVPNTVEMDLAVDGGGGASSHSHSPEFENGSFQAVLEWNGAPTISGTLHALQYDSDADSGLPTNYTGYARKPSFQINDPAGVEGLDLALESVATDTLTANVTPASAYDDVFMRVYRLRIGTGLINFRAEMQDGTGLDGIRSFKMPEIAGATAELIVQSVMVTDSEDHKGGSLVLRRNLATNADVAIALSLPPVKTAPTDGAIGLDPTTVFSWTGAAGLRFVEWSSSTPAGSAGSGDPTTYSFTIITAGNGATIPDLSPLGIELPRSTMFSWTVSVIEALTSMDLVASGNAAQVLGAQDELKLEFSSTWTTTTLP